MHIITISNRKGGVGKTTTAVTLGHALALHGRRTLIVDADPQGHVAISLGVEQAPGLFDLLVGHHPLRSVVRQVRENLFILPGNARTATAQVVLQSERAPITTLANILRHQRIDGKLDYVVIDTAPSVGDLQDMALTAADLVIIPSACDYLSLAGIADLVNALRTIQVSGWRGALHGILPTFYDDVTTESKTNLTELRTAFPGLVLDPIHRSTLLRECAAEGQTIWERDPNSRAAQEYATLMWRVLDATP